MYVTGNERVFAFGRWKRAGIYVRKSMHPNSPINLTVNGDIVGPGVAVPRQPSSEGLPAKRSALRTRRAAATRHGAKHRQLKCMLQEMSVSAGSEQVCSKSNISQFTNQPYRVRRHRQARCCCPAATVLGRSPREEECSSRAMCRCDPTRRKAPAIAMCCTESAYLCVGVSNLGVTRYLLCQKPCALCYSRSVLRQFWSILVNNANMSD